MRGRESQHTPDVDLRGEAHPSIVHARVFSLAFALLACGLALVFPARAAEVDCKKDFGAQVAEAIWLRDEDPESDPSEAAPPRVASENGTELDARTRFSLAVVIGDLLLLREQSGTAGWPRTLSRLSSQELRRRRDAPALDATACEIVRFMREHYSAERELDTFAVARPAESPSTPAPRPQPEALPPQPRSDPNTRVAVGTTPSPSSEAHEPRPSPPPPAPRALEPELAPSRPAPREPEPTPPPRLTRAPEPEPAPPRPAPRALESERRARVELSVLPDEETPAPPPPVDPPAVSVLPQPTQIERRPEPVEVPVEAEPAPAPEVVPLPPPDSAGARRDLAALETELAAPRYLTLRSLRRNGPSLPDDEVWRLRRQTLEAREELVLLLRRLSGDPARLVAVKSLLGARGCSQVETRIRDLFNGGPDSENVDLALQLWKRLPNPD